MFSALVIVMTGLMIVLFVVAGRGRRSDDSDRTDRSAGGGLLSAGHRCRDRCV